MLALSADGATPRRVPMLRSSPWRFVARSNVSVPMPPFCSCACPLLGVRVHGLRQLDICNLRVLDCCEMLRNKVVVLLSCVSTAHVTKTFLLSILTPTKSPILANLHITSHIDRSPHTPRRWRSLYQTCHTQSAKLNRSLGGSRFKHADVSIVLVFRGLLLGRNKLPR